MTRDELEATLIQYERGLQDLELLKVVQRGVGDLLIETLANIKPTLGYWEKDQIAFAIRAGPVLLNNCTVSDKWTSLRVTLPGASAAI